METPKRILVPTDFSEYADKVFDYALMLARQFKAELYLLHVISDIQQCAMDYCLTQDMVGQFRTASLEGAKAKIKDEVGRHADAKDVRMMTDVKIGLPYHEILFEADQKKIDLIVIATHGKSALLHQIMGSVAERVLRSAKCPILLMRF